MSKIQEALGRLRESNREKPASRSGVSAGRQTHLPDSVIPIAQNKKVVFSGERHELEEKDLIHGGLLAPLDQAIPVADEFRRIKRPLIENIFRVRGKDKDHMNLIMVASASPGSGKTFCSVNLAASISLERELNVLLVDGDVAKPHISKAFGLIDRPGLIDILEDDTRTIEEVLVRTNLNNIQVLPAGRKHSQSTELLASDRMAEVADELATRYPDRVIIMDSPPLLRTGEAQVVARHAGQIVFVIESGMTEHEEVQEALEMLDSGKPINAVLNKSIYSHPGGYYSGRYGYYGFNEKE